MISKEEKRTELMAPAGDFATLTAACKGGADAVYFGVDHFSMRAGKKNFQLKDLQKIREICSSYPRKPAMYLTLNTIVYDGEMRKLQDLVSKVKGKVDAIICSDIAVMELCRENNIPFIVSTQCSVANKEAARFFRDMGAKRVVLARELNIGQVKEISKLEGVETEVFVHGAMCVAVSGRCFTSQFLFNRSANRGECGHPCRRSYLVKEKESGYELELYNDKVMSAKDLCTLPFMEDLKKAGVAAFKIEGRNRDARYVREVVGAYRKALDQNLDIKETISLMERLEKVFHREFSGGFYLGRPLFTDFAKVEDSASKFYKEYTGRVVHFYPQAGVVLVEVKKKIKVGDKIAFIGENMGSEEVEIEEMEKDKGRIKEAQKGEVVGIKTPFVVKKNTEVYKIQKRN